MHLFCEIMKEIKSLAFAFHSVKPLLDFTKVSFSLGKVFLSTWESAKLVHNAGRGVSERSKAETNKSGCFLLKLRLVSLLSEED